MQKAIAWVLAVLLACGGSCRSTYASGGDEAKRLAKFKLQVEGLPQGAALRVKLMDHRVIFGELTSHSDDDFQLATPQAVSVRYSEVKSIATVPDGQVARTNSQFPPPHHSHLLRNAIIGFAVGFAFYLWAAMETK